MLKTAISNTDLSLSKICTKINQYGFNLNKGYLSKLQNGKKPPASDKVNLILSEVLKIDHLELRAAAYREKLPQDVLEKLKQASNSA